MVSMLDRKLVRDLVRMRAQLFAIVMVVACGIATFVSILSVHESLGRNRDEYYAATRMGDIFSHLSRAPNALRERMREIPGVASVQTRIVRDVTLDIPGLSEPGLGRIVSVPSRGRPQLNDLHLRRGRWLEPLATDEVMIAESLALANALEPGDQIQAIIGGRRQTLTIVGIVLSPEYVYSVPPGGLWPDDKRFGALFMDETALAAALDLDGAFNDVSLAIRADASEADVIERLDALLADYGGLRAYGREDQISARFLRQELEQLQGIGGMVPVIFLGVAAFLLNVVITRLVGMQREQIAALKALGYGNRRIGLHYFEMVLLVVLIGTGLGIAAGVPLGEAMMGLYGDFFRFPVLEFYASPKLVGTAVLASLIAGVIGAWAAVRGAVKLPPAEAMRPPAPDRFHKGTLERLGLGKLFSPAGRIVLRNVERRPFRTLLASFGIALALAVLIAGSFSNDALDYIMDVSFERVQRQDLTVSLVRPLPRRAIYELASVPGVVYAEPIRNVPVTLRKGHRNHDTAVRGMLRDSAMRKLLDAELREVPLPPEGVLLSRVLGDKLELEVGDTVELEVLEDEHRVHRVQVGGFIDELMGMSAYMELDALNRLLGEGPKISGAELVLDPTRRDHTYREIKRLPSVAGASLRTAAYDIFNETTAEMQFISIAILTFFATVVAVGVVYNSARVVLSERSRELGSLRVIGFTRAEISTILLGELAVQLLLALPLGCWLGYAMAAAMVENIDTELFRFPLIISPRTYAFAVLVVVVSGTLAALLVRRKLDRLDLIGVLKTRE